MRIKDLVKTKDWNSEDKKAYKNAKPNMDKAIKAHENLLKELIPVKRRLEAHLKNLQRQEFGQGQNFDEIQEFKDKIMQLDNEIEESKENVKKFERIYKNIMQILD